MGNDYNIADAFSTIEDELIDSMIRNMKRHRVEEVDEGKQWEMWQSLQLRSLEEYKQKNHKKFNGRFSDINDQIDEVIRQANKSGKMEQELEILQAIKDGFKGARRASSTMQAEFFRLNERKLDALIKATKNDMKKAETAILRMADDQYRKVIFNAQVYANTGAGTYEKAVDMATKDMLSAGLNCVEYANGARHTLKDYADMAIRTASKRAYLQGEGEKRQEWGITTVIMNKRGNSCPKCLPFVGKILIDDVWSGGKASDGPYPLMSSAIAAGLYHPRCKDSHTTYFEGISSPPDDTYESQEVEDIKEDYALEQKLQVAKRNYEKYSRLSEQSLDEENKERYRVKSKEWLKQYEHYYKQAEQPKSKRRYDKKQFERYRDVLKDHVPKKFEDFLKMKYNDVEGYGKLKHAYRVANQYEPNSGNMDPMKVVELHDEAVACKAQFTGKARKGANMGVMEIDGKVYIANSNVNDPSNPAYVNYKGNKEQIILKTDQPRFHPFQVGSHPGEVDSECKLFEFASTIAEDGKKHSIKMLSERCMCPSCQSVMAEFKEKYPDVDIEVVSHKKEKADKNKNENPIFKKDVELRYKRENN